MPKIKKILMQNRIIIKEHTSNLTYELIEENKPFLYFLGIIKLL